MTLTAYLELLDWTARQLAPGKSAAASDQAPPVLERLQIEPEVWCGPVSGFGRLFSLMADLPKHIDRYRSGKRGSRFRRRRATRKLLQR